MAIYDGDATGHCVTPFDCPSGICIAQRCGPINAFRMISTFSVGGEPSIVTAADIDGDRRQDLVVGNQGRQNRAAPSLSVLVNQGKKQFANKFLSISSAPTKVATGDINGDGIADLVVGNFLDIDKHDVALFKGLGGGSFAPSALLEAGMTPHDVVIADLDGDGRNDVAVANAKEYFMSLLMNRGGALQPQLKYLAKGPSAATALTSADFDSDGVMDLAMLTSFGNLEITSHPALLVAQTVTAVRGQPHFHIIAADFNGDTRPDLAVADVFLQGEYYVRILLNNGGWRFSEGELLTVPRGFGALAAVDLNGDKAVDLAVCNYVIQPGKESQIRIFLNQGAGKFRDAGTYRANANSWDIAAADMDGDGRPDLIVLDADKDTVNIWFNSGLW